MILVTYHHDGVVALCDADLIGKEFEEGKMFLHGNGLVQFKL